MKKSCASKIRQAIFLSLVLIALGGLLIQCSDGAMDEENGIQSNGLTSIYGVKWPQYTIHTGMEGADGVDIGDINKDGRMDITTGWEGQGEVMLYLNPSSSITSAWPKGNIKGGLGVDKVEDAVFADFNTDGLIDAVVTASEGKKRVGIHWLLSRTGNYTSTSLWKGTALASESSLFLKAKVGQIDGVGANDIVAGSKSENGYQGKIFWFKAPANPTKDNANLWKAYELATVHWAKAFEILDMDGDGDNDILYADGEQIGWLKNPGGVTPVGPWQKIVFGAGNYLSLCDLDKDGVMDVLGAKGGRDARWYRRLNPEGTAWETYSIDMDATIPNFNASKQTAPHKGIQCGDIDGDGKLDVSLTTSGQGVGVMWFSYNGTTPRYSGVWKTTLLTDYKSEVKYDNHYLLDLDKDGDLDIVTTEENLGLFGYGLGVVWYRNPLK